MSTNDAKTPYDDRLESSLPTRPIRFPPIAAGGTLANLRISGGAVFQDGSMQIDGRLGIDQAARIRFHRAPGADDFTIEMRTGPRLPGPRSMTLPEKQSLLLGLRTELRSQNPGITQEVAKLFAGRLAQSLGQAPPSTLFDSASFTRVERTPGGGVCAHVGIDVDLTGTILLHEDGKLTYEQRLVARHDGVATPLSVADRESLALNIERHMRTEGGKADPLWSELLASVRGNAQ
jgi:hypothetical protein